MAKTSLLSRYAEALYWMARYIERAENVARILDVNESFSRDATGNQNWQSTLQLYADEESFKEHYDEVTAENVINFYTSWTSATPVRSSRPCARRGTTPEPYAR